MGGRFEHTLCWDCAKATSAECPWAESGTPVPGWKAKKTKLKFSREVSTSFHVKECPLFERDARHGGVDKYVALGGETNERSNSNNGGATDAVYRMAQFLGSGYMGSRNCLVVDCGDRKARVLNSEREVLDLAYGILERAVMDWKALEYGRKETAMVEKAVWVERSEVVAFFFSKWFARLCEPLHYSPEEIRAALNIPEEARAWMTQSS